VDVWRPSFDLNPKFYFITTLLITTVQIRQPVILMVSTYASVKNSDQCLHSCCWNRFRGHSLLSRLGDTVVRGFGQVDLGVDRVGYGVRCRILWQGRGQKGCLGFYLGCGWIHKKGHW
jgi:hypothetical protein